MSGSFRSSPGHRFGSFWDHFGIVPGQLWHRIGVVLGSLCILFDVFLSYRKLYFRVRYLSTNAPELNAAADGLGQKPSLYIFMSLSILPSCLHFNDFVHSAFLFSSLRRLFV